MSTLFRYESPEFDTKQKLSLQQQLLELTALFVSLQAGTGVALAIYSETGGFIAASSECLEFGAQLSNMPPVDSDEICLSGASPHPQIACKRIDSTVLHTRPLFVVRAQQLERPVLENLSQCGAAFMSHHLELLAQSGAFEQVVREQEAIIDHISDALLVFDRNRAIRYVNARAAKLLKIDADTCIGEQLNELVDFDLNIEPVFRTGRGYIDRELSIDSPQRHLHILDTAIPIRDDNGQVISVVNTFREMSRVRELSQRLAGDIARYHFTDLLGSDRMLRQCLAAAQRAARTDSNVLICGESGTGKEILAQAIHNDGRRSNGPFVAINCAALPRDQIESELFGFTNSGTTGGRPGRFEQASGGTIFLDKISEMPLDVQGKLLRVLQEHQITRIGDQRSVTLDVRVIATSGRDLADMVLQQTFREDLYYRLNVIRIDLPSLRERTDDILLLAEEFIRRYSNTLNRPPIRLGKQARQQLLECDWRGNVRQLQNLVERILNLCNEDLIESLPTDWLRDEVHRDPLPAADGTWSRVMTLHDCERLGIRLALEASGYNITHTADTLGITRPTLYAKMKRHGFHISSRLNERHSLGH